MLTKKKLLSLLLALVMVFSLLPTVAIPAAAASPNSTASTALVLPVNGSISGEGYGTIDKNGNSVPTPENRQEEQWYKITTTTKGYGAAACS